jgi:Leucine-rich repeat (LRR) protein
MSVFREKSNLLQLTTLYIFEPWELDPDDAPLFLNSNLPKEIGCLNNLTELILYIGNISELPSEIGKLNALTKLEIIIDSVWEEDFYRDAGYVIRSIDRLPREIVYLKNLTSLVIRGIPSLILSYTQKFWIQQLKDNGCEVDIENNISELDEIPY